MKAPFSKSKVLGSFSWQRINKYFGIRDKKIFLPKPGITQVQAALEFTKMVM